MLPFVMYMYTGMTVLLGAEPTGFLSYTIAVRTPGMCDNYYENGSRYTLFLKRAEFLRIKPKYQKFVTARSSA